MSNNKNSTIRSSMKLVPLAGSMLEPSRFSFRRCFGASVQIHRCEGLCIVGDGNVKYHVLAALCSQSFSALHHCIIFVKYIYSHLVALTSTVPGPNKTHHVPIAGMLLVAFSHPAASPQQDFL